MCAHQKRHLKPSHSEPCVEHASIDWLARCWQLPHIRSFSSNSCMGASTGRASAKRDHGARDER
jgi:hypothetical protein